MFSFLNMLGVSISPAFLSDITGERVYGWFTFGLSAIAVLGVLIVVHEFGHFIVARMVGIRVEKFSVGFGKRLFGWKRGDTDYMISLIPLGGYVKFYGADSDEENPVVDEKDAFLNQAVWKRLATVIAGPVFNLILAVAIMAWVAMIGVPVVKLADGTEKPYYIAAAMDRMGQAQGSRVIDEVMEGSAAEKAGIQAGDRIDAVNDKPISSWMDMVNVIQGSPEKEVLLTVLRQNESIDLKVVPSPAEVQTMEGETITIGRIGILQRHGVKSYPFMESLRYGVEWTWDLTALTALSISKLVSRDIPANEIAGPIGIMQIAGKAAESGFVNLLFLIGLISVNLGILNLLPIPVLDGGHIVFFSLEAILGKPLNIKAQEIAQQVGIVLLLSLMALAFYNDIVRLIS